MIGPFRQTAMARVPRGIWALGLVSLLMDVSSEMIHSLLPVFMVARSARARLCSAWSRAAPKRPA